MNKEWNMKNTLFLLNKSSFVFMMLSQSSYFSSLSMLLVTVTEDSVFAVGPEPWPVLWRVSAKR